MPQVIPDHICAENEIDRTNEQGIINEMGLHLGDKLSN